MRPCRQCRAPIENSFVLCPHCRAPQNDVWQKPGPAPEPKHPRTGRRWLSILAFPSDEVFHGLALLVLPIVAGGLIGYFFNGTDGAVVGMFVAFGVMILVAFLWAGGDAGG